MSKYCFLCLSDEGVFLNVTPNNYQSLYGEVETYLPVKIDKKGRKPIKVCYKCAFELKQCSDFVKRYKESRTSSINKSSRKLCCNLCLETPKKGYIFKLNEDNDPLNDPLSKIKKLFHGNLAEIDKSTLICLTCRYTLDVLFDLTYLCQELSKLKDRFNKDIDYSEIPKVNTAVIRRKTTNNPSLRIKTYVISESDSDSNITTNQSEAKINEVSQPKHRLCDQCHNSVEHGEDMYKFYKTGLTVCKTCWANMDLDKHSTEKDKQNMKLCTVFLKDVFTDTTLKKQKAYRVEKDSYGNKVFIVTESESEVEVEDKVKVSKESEKIQTKGQKRPKLEAKGDSSENDSKSKKRVKVSEQNTSHLPNLNKMTLRPHRKRTPTSASHYSDTDTLPKTSSQSSNMGAGKRRNASVSDVDAAKKRTRTTLRSLLANLKPLQDDDVTSDDSSTNSSFSKADSKMESTINLKKRKKFTRLSSVSTTESDSSEIKNSKGKKLSETSIEKSKLSEKRVLSDRTDVDETNKDVNKDYTCSKCGVIHENKLIAATHELIHFKQLELKLHKLNIQDKLKDEQQADESGTKQSIDELTEQQNEDITLSINCDEDIESADTTVDTTKKLDKKKCVSSTKNQEKDSLQADVNNKESTEEFKSAETIAEPVLEESTKTDEHEVKISKTTAQNELTASFTDNGNSQSESAKDDQIQNDNFGSDEVEDKQKEINEEIISEERTAENKSVENAESEIIEVTDADEKKENENAESTENENIKLHQSSTAEIVDDTMNEAEKEDKAKSKEDKIEEKEDKVKEIEKDKVEKSKATDGKEKEQSSDVNVKDDQTNSSANNGKLNDAINIDETRSDNLSQEKQELTKADNNGKDKVKINTKIVDNITSEDNIENINSKTDNCPSTEKESEQANTACSNHVEKESKCKDSVETLLNNTENASSSQLTLNKEESIDKSDMDAIDAATEMVEHIFNLARDESDSGKSLIDRGKKYNEMEAETLENISREIQKSADMPSLDPISFMEVDHNKELI